MAEVYAAVVDTEIVGQFREQGAEMLLALLERFYQASSAPGGATTTGSSHPAPARRERVELAEFVP